MATLAGQRAQFTWALNQYNLAEDTEKQAHFAKVMAKYIANAPANGFTVEQVTQEQPYPITDVAQFLSSAGDELDTGISEGEALRKIVEAVDTAHIQQLGDGKEIVYAYGYRCAPDRLKIGLTKGDAVDCVAAQIGRSTPDRPVLFLEIKTHDCKSLERALHAVLKYRGSKVQGGGTEWFRTTREEIVSLYELIKAEHE